MLFILFLFFKSFFFFFKSRNSKEESGLILAVKNNHEEVIFICFKQCIGSGAVGSTGFRLPGSGSAKLCGSTDPAKYQLKHAKNKILLSKSKSELKKRDYKNFLISEWLIKF